MFENNKLRKIPEFKNLFQQIENTQENEWDGLCSMKECYWNMWSPKVWPNNFYCTSENLCNTKMIPNSTNCPSYLDYFEFCGCNKGK